jgi:hypothetical protein
MQGLIVLFANGQKNGLSLEEALDKIQNDPNVSGLFEQRSSLLVAI